MSEYGAAPAGPKVVSIAEGKRRVEEARAAGKMIVYTNGCFDLIHGGHVRTLESARQMGDLLVVGLNGDESTRQLKGPGRPIMPEGERAEILAAFACVDLVVIFREVNSLPTLRALRPDIWVKGGDYTLDTVNQEERAYVESYGGKVALSGHVPGASTTDIIGRVKALDSG